ncbi:hypothetical protein GCM10023189_55730 [Nibrella saemangeumensis]|uniref:Response regulatory domain-containing protein n=1 Tax=Nibrella saemangeumensis TaxID=1084526 RepID=A0ABP8NLD1_9BACT
MMTIGSILNELRETFSPANWTVYSTQRLKTIRIAVCDDYSLYRRALSMVLGRIQGFEVVLQAANGQQLLDQISSARPDVVLLDLDMPVMDGAATADILLRTYPNIEIILLTLGRENVDVSDLLKKGIQVFVSKDADPDEIEMAIRKGELRKQYWRKR